MRKRRTASAPFLIWMGGSLVGILDAGMRVLPQRAWHERERLVYAALGRGPIGIDRDGTLVLPCLGGEPLATLLEDAQLEQSAKLRAIDLAVAALADFHRRGFTHGDAMADNVLIDLDAGVAHWIDFETVHGPDRSLVWRRADDLRALLATCLLRTTPHEVPATLSRILNSYGDEDAARHVATTFTTPFLRPLLFHLGQAGLSFEMYRDIASLLAPYVADGDR